VPAVGCRAWLKSFMPIGVVFATSLWLSNLAYLFISVAFIQFIKKSTILAVLLISFAMRLEKPACEMFGYIAIIACGTSLACLAQPDVNVAGTLIQFGALLAEAVRVCLVNKLLVSKGIRLSSVAMLYYVAPACFLCLLPSWLFLSNEFARLRDVGFRPIVDNLGVPVLLLNSSVAVCLNLSSIALIAYTSALTINISAIFKDMLLILFSVVVNGAQVTLLQYVGYLVAVVGVWHYGKYKRALALRVKADAERAAAQAEAIAGGDSGRTASGER